jgi:hypothetical protein
LFGLHRSECHPLNGEVVDRLFDRQPRLDRQADPVLHFSKAPIVPQRIEDRLTPRNTSSRENSAARL